MAKVRTLSRKFLKGHPREGQETFFVEQVLNALGIRIDETFLDKLFEWNKEKIKLGKLTNYDLINFDLNLNNSISGQKLHTIRGGQHFQKGDKIQLAVWSGKPYQSPQIKICPELEVVKTYDFRIKNGYVLIDNSKVANKMLFDRHQMITQIAQNDGLSVQDFKDWFKYPSDFIGQVICWVDPKY